MDEVAAVEEVRVALFAQSATGVDLDGALASVNERFGLEGAVAMLSTPIAFHFGRVGAGRVEGPDGLRLSPSQVFEARVFTPHVEMRWVADEAGGRAAVLHERPDVRLADPWVMQRVHGLVGTLAATHLLWGWPLSDGEDLPEGWCWLGEARIGAMAVPHPPSPGRLTLAAVEYVGVDEEHGNARVVTERLLRIEPVPAEEE